MTGPREQRLEQLAKARGWRLRWETEPLVAWPGYNATSLDIFCGKRIVNVSGPVSVIHAGAASPRDTIAAEVLNVIAQAPRMRAGARR